MRGLWAGWCRPRLVLGAQHFGSSGCCLHPMCRTLWAHDTLLPNQFTRNWNRNPIHHSPTELFCVKFVAAWCRMKRREPPLKKTNIGKSLREQYKYTNGTNDGSSSGVGALGKVSWGGDRGSRCWLVPKTFLLPAPLRKAYLPHPVWFSVAAPVN